MENHAEFAIIEVKPDYIYIQDISDSKPSMTVTSDAARVVAELHERFNITEKRIFYMDTMQNIDELDHENGIFKGFRPGHGGYDLKKIYQ
jgi:hypothetical protein